MEYILYRWIGESKMWMKICRADSLKAISNYQQMLKRYEPFRATAIEKRIG